jgi:hypothetical protein
MIAYIALGFAAFAIALIVFTMYSGYLKDRAIKQEAFENPPHEAFYAKVTPGGSETQSTMAPAGFNDPASEKLVASAGLPAMSEPEALANWGKMSSERCFRKDIGESLKKTRNYLQRTNNYQHIHPDSCSAPNHEFIGTFYKPEDGVGLKPKAGTNYPESTQ